MTTTHTTYVFTQTRPTGNGSYFNHAESRVFSSQGEAIDHALTLVPYGGTVSIAVVIGSIEPNPRFIPVSAPPRVR